MKKSLDCFMMLFILYGIKSSNIQYVNCTRLGSAQTALLQVVMQYSLALRGNAVHLLFLDYHCKTRMREAIKRMALKSLLFVQHARNAETWCRRK